MDYLDLIENFKSAIISSGITPPAHIEADGKLHRYSTNGKTNDTAGWYVLYPDGVAAGAFGCWRKGIDQTWCSRECKTLSGREKEEYGLRLTQIRAEREKDKKQRHEEARQRANEIWNQAKEITGHPYLEKKQVKNYGIKESKGNIVVPVCDGDTICSLQFIKPDGSKKFLTGGRKKGCYFVIGAATDVICICEGYATAATVHEATGYMTIVAFDASNLKPVGESIRAKYQDAKLVFCADDDAFTEGNPGLTKAKEDAIAMNGYVAVPNFGDTRQEDQTDFNDLYKSKGLDMVKQQIIFQLEKNRTATVLSENGKDELNKIVGVSLSELLSKELPPRENILSPWLPKSGLCMVYAERGVGKTFFALEVAMAVAYGDEFLSFKAQRPCGVLYIDGEMPANTMQERLALIEKRKKPNADMIEPIFITPDLQKEPMPNLSTVEGQEAITKYVEKAELIIVDNISTLCGHGKENEAQDWIPIQQWVLQLRRQGKAVLFIHHAGKNGLQRGTSKREDILDTVIKLNRPYNYSPSIGASFEVHFEKARGIMGEDVTPIQCTLENEGWKHNVIEISIYEKVVELYNNGAPQGEIVEETGKSKSYISKLVKKAREKGDING